MIITLIFLALFVVVGAVYYIVGESVDKSQMAKNLDLSIDGLFKALGIVTVCAGLMSILPNQELVGVSSAEAIDQHQVEEVVAKNEINGSNETYIGESSLIENGVIETIDLSIYQDGIYQGEGKGFKGYITMEVEIEYGEITRVEVVNHRDDRKWFNRANSVVPQSIIDAQSADVDTVSGATYTSLGMIDGAEEALSKSRGE